jgi:hypothetical protein
MTRLMVVCLLALSAGSAAAIVQAPDLSGKWNLVPEAGAPPDGSNGRGSVGGFYCGGDCTITQTAKTLAVTSSQGTSGTLTFNLDGTLSRNVVGGGRGDGFEMNSVAIWSGGKLTITTTRELSGGQSVTSTHVLSLANGNMIVAATTRQGGPPVTLMYRRASATR